MISGIFDSWKAVKVLGLQKCVWTDCFKTGGNPAAVHQDMVEIKRRASDPGCPNDFGTVFVADAARILMVMGMLMLLT